MRKCINCDWKGLDEEIVSPLQHCPVCGDRTVQAKEKEEEVEKVVKKEEFEKVDFDLDNDGDVDKDDRSIAGRLLGSKKGRKKNVKRKR